MTETGLSQKSADAYRTISEVAADLKLPQHVLRFWETRFSQVKPLKRAGGRRFYRPEDVDLLRAVKALLYGDGYTIKGVQRILREQGPKAVAALAASPSRGGARRSSEPPATEPEIAAAMSVALPMPQQAPAPTRADIPLLVAGAGPRSEAETPHDPAARLRAVLDELVDCARLLASVRTASR